MKSDNYSKNTFYYICGFGIVTASNFAFTSIASRLMGPEYYGIFNAFFYFLIGLTWANSSLQLASAKYVTVNKIESTSLAVKELSLDFWLSGFIIFCIILALYPFFKLVYRLNDPAYTIAGAGIAALSLVIAGYRGIYQGRMEFLKLSFNTGMEMVIRAAAAFFLIIAGWKVMGALGASIVGSAAAIFLLLGPFVRVIFEKRELKINWGLLGTYLNTCLVLVPFGLIYALDLIIVKYCIGGVESGYLSLCAQFGKNLITLSLFFSNVVFSYSLKNRKGHFWAGILLTVLSFSLASFFTVIFGKWIVMFLSGEKYLPAAEILPVYIIASLPLGIMLNILNYSIARNIKLISAAVWLILALLAGLYYLTLSYFSLNVFLWVMGGAVMTADLALLALVFLQKPFGAAGFEKTTIDRIKR